MSQAALFDIPVTPKAKREPVRIERRQVAVPFGHKDRSGKYWYERFEADLRENLTSDERDVLLEILLEWPAIRVDAIRCLLNRWAQAQPLERDNFAESLGR